MTNVKQRLVVHSEVLKFFFNGILASLIHFLALWVCLKVFNFGSAGLSNLIASIFGITVSFFGNRHFVFNDHTETILQQLSKFIGLYIVIAIIHVALSFIITDYFGIDYRVSFLVAVITQMVFGFFGSKFLVFSK